ncbi:type 1 fimbrial protein [Citrobacter cronae]|uniref:fimbrial protein n=1 Tax=Citrobacter cronae TaxID=1748967 RepID=UPI0018FFFABF|nr:type 1 fimbrial protein [Citrobacter cronae]MBJ8362578.1 type 1 fimbrial protein [Citrobacter cronae]
MKKNLLAVSTLAMAVMSGSAFAAPGDAIGNGTGNVNITGTVTTSTCGLSVTGADQTFALTKDQIVSAQAGDTLTTADATFTLNNCKGTALSVTMKGGAAYYADRLFNAFDKVAGLRYQLRLQNGNDGRWAWDDGSAVTVSEPVFPSDATQDNAIVFTAKTDADSFNVRTLVSRSGENLPATLPSEVKATYAYNITYK